ncbi:MAG: BlaI/MecI/CopY family transcriptional regulator [Terriglobales bacterium]
MHSRREKLVRLSRLELRILEVLWSRGAVAIREIQESMAGAPAYTTVQTTVYRLEAKGAVRRTRKIGNAHIFEAVVTRAAAQRRLIDDFLGVLGGRTQPIMAHFIESGRMTLADLHEAEAELRKHQQRGNKEPKP